MNQTHDESVKILQDLDDLWLAVEQECPRGESREEHRSGPWEHRVTIRGIACMTKYLRHTDYAIEALPLTPAMSAARFPNAEYRDWWYIRGHSMALLQEPTPLDHLWQRAVLRTFLQENRRISEETDRLIRESRWA